jgi:lipopolysaccharide assembly outer membrane protein LptD (OstA)
MNRLYLILLKLIIIENGNQINGYKGGTATSEDGSTISAQNFFYNKLTNILETSGNVKYIDKEKNIIITADKAIYLKNDEKIYTTTKVNNNNTITASIMIKLKIFLKR